MGDTNMVKNIPNNNSNSNNTIEYAYEKQNILMDEIIKKMYNYDLYGRYKNKNYLVNNPHEYNYNDLSGVLNKNINVQNTLLDSIVSEGDRLEKSYDYNASIYQNQLNTNNIVAREKDVVQKRYESTEDQLRANHKQHEIYRYQYYKHRAQMKILYYFILLMVLTIIVIYFNRNFNVIINNALFVIILGFMYSFYLIFLLRQLYDIHLRSKFVFDEYENTNKPNISTSNSSNTLDSSTDDDDEECDSQWSKVN